MPTTRLESGAELLHYRLVEPLGEGGMGVVWKGVDTSLDREVAIKFLPEAFAADPERLSRFEREAKLLASLSHPNVAAVYGLHEAAGVRFLAMELVRGETLTSAIAQGLQPRQIVELGTRIADGLAAAHRQHVIHRDLKPDNILIDADGRPKILDFGLAKVGVSSAPDEETALFESEPTQAGTVLGTVAYMSPEQAQGQAVDPRSDIFSLGIVLYEMATGRRPFTGENSISTLSSILRDAPPSIREVTPSAPSALERIVHRCLEKKPEDRYDDASGLRDDLVGLRDRLASESGSTAAAPRRSRRGRMALAALAVVALALLGSWWLRRETRQSWLHQEALPQLQAIVEEIQGLQEGRESWDAFLLAREIEAVAPEDPILESLRAGFSREVAITSTPPGARVFARFYDEPDAEPLLIGTTPMERVSYPLGITRLRFELEGREPVADVVWNFAYFLPDGIGARFLEGADIPEGMTFVPSGESSLFMPGLNQVEPVPTQAFFVDRYEVTNREYKRFVDAGGYSDQEYWQEPFLEDGRELTWEEATARFTDRAGRPGPATWEVGVYPEGEDDFPVTGVSWFEAAAYAEWAGSRLPTAFHWNRVAFIAASSRIVPMANLAAAGPVPVGSTRSENRFGAHDLAGNVREWVWNESEGGRRLILGGGWDDPDYAFVDAYAQSPFDRSPTNGFRCIRFVDGEPRLAELERPIQRPFRDFFAETPVSDEVFAQFLRLYHYDEAPLDATIEDERPTEGGTRQKITFNAAYGDERMMAYLFLPETGEPPYQAVVQFPGSGSIQARSSESLTLRRTNFLLRSGRAVLWPIYKGTYERGGDLRSNLPRETTRFKDYMVMWGKDFSRSIDYLESRDDIDPDRIAYYGLSWGGSMGAILPAIEPRIQASVLYVAGLHFQRALPEADELNYVTRVTQPTLILNGEHDFFFPLETSQRPLFELLGTPPEDKKRLVFPGGHSVPRAAMMKESLAWLDKYLGPVGGQ